MSYTPTGFDPTVTPIKHAVPEDIRADLKAVRALADASGVSRAGIITYGTDFGLDVVPRIAREFSLSVIVGVFNPRSMTEVRNLEALLSDVSLDETIVGCCVGNEALTFRRASMDDVRWVARRLREVYDVPVTTTEVVHEYADRRLWEFDFTLVNVHPIHSSVFDPQGAADWSVQKAEDLVATAPERHPVVIKEFGFPSAPEPFDESQQLAYWKAILGHSVARRVNVGFFDAFENVPWKNEKISLPGGKRVNVGPYWSVLFDRERVPKPGAVELLRMWKATRSR